MQLAVEEKCEFLPFMSPKKVGNCLVLEPQDLQGLCRQLMWTLAIN